MTQSRTEAALERIEAALTRIERVKAGGDGRYEKLRSDVEGSLSQLDELIVELAR